MPWVLSKFEPSYRQTQKAKPRSISLSVIECFSLCVCKTCVLICTFFSIIKHLHETWSSSHCVTAKLFLRLVCERCSSRLRIKDYTHSVRSTSLWVSTHSSITFHPSSSTWLWKHQYRFINQNLYLYCDLGQSPMEKSWSEMAWLLSLADRAKSR